MTAGNQWDAPTYGVGMGGLPQQGYVAGPGPWGLPTARSIDPGRLPCIIGAVLFGVDGVLNLIAIFGPDHAWKSPVNEALIALLTLGCVLAAALLVPLRTRGLGVGLAIGQALTETARFVFAVEPSAIHQWNLVESLSNLGTYIATALAGIVVAIAMVRERRFAPRGGRQPLPALVLGVPGAVLVVLGLLVDDYRLDYGGGADSFSYACCGWSTGGAFGKTADVLTGLALVACVLLAALVARVGFGKGVLAGVALFALAEAAIGVITVIGPMQASYGFGETGQAISAHPESGLWFSLAGTALFIIAFFVYRYGIGSGRAADAVGQYPAVAPGYPMQPGYPGAPGYPQQAGFGQPAWQQQPQMPQMQQPQTQQPQTQQPQTQQPQMQQPQMQQQGSWPQPAYPQPPVPQSPQFPSQPQSTQPQGQGQQQQPLPPPPFGQSSWPPAPPQA